MSNTDLNINITLNDKITGALQNAGHALENFHSNMRTVGRETLAIGTQFALLGATITGPFALAFATWGKSSLEGASLMADFGNTMDDIQSKLSQAVAPSFEALTEKIEAMLDAFNKLSPATQQSILQGIYLTGVFITIGGVMTSIVGKIIEVSANIAGLSGKFIEFITIAMAGEKSILGLIEAFVVANPMLIVFAGLVAVIITALGGWNDAFKILINTAEIFFNSISGSLNQAAAGWIKMAEVVVAAEEGIAKAMLNIPGINKQVVQESINWWDQLGNKLADMANNKIVAVGKAMKDTDNIISTGSGEWVKAFNSFQSMISNSIGVAKDLTINIKPIKTALDDATASAVKYFKAMTSSEAQTKQANTDAVSSLKQLATLTNEASNRKLLTARNETTAQENLLKEYEKEFQISQQGMAQLQANVAASFQTNMSNALTGIVTGTETAKQAFTALGQAMLKTIVDYMAQKLVAFVTEHTILAGTVAASTTAATAIAAAWSSAAAAVSLATLGGNAPPAAAGMISTETLATALFATPRAFGGDDIVTKPTLFLAGENGPERATFTPLGRGNGGGMGNQISIYIQNPSLQSNQDITRVAQLLGFKLQQIMRTGGGI